MKKPPTKKPTRVSKMATYTRFKDFINNRKPLLSSEKADLVEVPLDKDFPPEAGLRIYLWGDEPTGGMLVEAYGNKTVHLTAKYFTRYDPPRTASTGSGQEPKGDWHLYQGQNEIAAWDTNGKARHGFPSGTKLPRKAYDALIDQYPNATGLKGRVLEDILKRLGGKSFLVEG